MSSESGAFDIDREVKLTKLNTESRSSGFNWQRNWRATNLIEVITYEMEEHYSRVSKNSNVHPNHAPVSVEPAGSLRAGDSV